MEHENENQMEHENENQMEHENENQMEHENENQTEHENENQLEHENENQLEYENENQLEDENENQLEDEKENQLEHGKENQLEHGKENQLEHGKENQLEHGKENQFHQSNKRPIKSASPFLGEKRRRYEQVSTESITINSLNLITSNDQLTAMDSTKNLKHDLICSYLSKNHISESLSIIPAREKNIDLLFISPPQASLIESWINCTTIDHISLTISTTKLQYRWNLLYQGSRDGFSPVVFHEKCDNQGRCVVITKIRNSTTIIGGYNPIGWYSSYGYYEETQDSFICLFKNFYDLKNYKLSRVISPENAIFQQNEFGPDFGEPDFLLFGENNETYCTTGCAYEEAIDLGHFEVDDYVVYQIVSNNEELVEEEKNNNIK
ncbi:9257_t:CDS:2 [Entrophospora sp. SA101]|nr:9257_t:CDS:2 [Entrophospora sp. SA101]